jgi:putative transposase
MQISRRPPNNFGLTAGGLFMPPCTSRMVKKEFPVEFAKWYSKQSFWSGSYYVASSGGAPIEKLKEYIKNQDAPTN